MIGPKTSNPPELAWRERAGLKAKDRQTKIQIAAITVRLLTSELRIESRFFQRKAISGGPRGESGNGPDRALGVPTLGNSPLCAAAFTAARFSARAIDPSSNEASVLETQ